MGMPPSVSQSRIFYVTRCHDQVSCDGDCFGVFFAPDRVRSFFIASAARLPVEVGPAAISAIKAFSFYSSSEIRHRYVIAPSVLVVACLWTSESRSGESAIDNGPAECEKPPGPTGAGVREGDRLAREGPPQHGMCRIFCV